jgi:hypothetical protein
MEFVTILLYSAPKNKAKFSIKKHLLLTIVSIRKKMLIVKSKIYDI